MEVFDAAIVGAGAAGLFCAGMAGQRGLRVLLLDHAPKVAEKIRISGGGRCNFTNREVRPEHFLSDDPHFCRSALARYPSTEFIALVQRHRIAFHEKHKGQLFCDESSQNIIDLLLRECEAGGVAHRQPCAVQAVRHDGTAFELDTSAGPVRCTRLVVATGGLSVPQIGATDWGYRVARQFGHRVVEPRPALVPLTFEPAAWAPFAALAGVALPVRIETGAGPQRGCFDEDLLFTHRGLSGPAVLQISSYWRSGLPVQVDLHPAQALEPLLMQAKRERKQQLGNALAQWLPQRVADAWITAQGLPGSRTLPDLRDRDLAALAQALNGWRVMPNGTEGFKKAEVTAGGVDTRELSSRSMESRRMSGLHFIGEVVDVTGWLGGYNFQWAWASAAACAGSLEVAR